MMPSMVTDPKLRQMARMLADENTFATVLLVIAADRYGLEIVDWEPETLQMELEEDFGIDIPESNIHKLFAAIAILGSDRFYKQLPDLIELSNILSGDLFDPGLWDPATTEELAWGLTEAALISPPDSPQPFSPEILGYIQAVLREEGYIVPPAVLQFAVDPDAAATIAGAFADDPEMFTAIYETAREKAREVDLMVASRLQQLFQQLQSLSLENGTTKGIENKVREMLAAGGQAQ